MKISISIFQDAKAILNEKFIWFAYHKDEPIGFLIVFPDMNQVFRKLKNGKLNSDEYSQVDVLQKTGYHRGRLLLSGVIPEFQRTGVVGGIYLKAYRCHARRAGWKNLNFHG